MKDTDISQEKTQEVQNQLADHVTAASLIVLNKKPYKTNSDVCDHFTEIKKKGEGLTEKTTSNYCFCLFIVCLQSSFRCRDKPKTSLYFQFMLQRV